MADIQRAYRQGIASVLDHLGEALQWIGLEHGRVATYKRLLAEYYEGQRSNEHFFAFYQAMDILSIFNSWKGSTTSFPGIHEKISVVFKKGPILPEQESASANSNRPRNDGFVYIFGGKLLHATDVTILSIDGTKNNSLTPPDPGSDCPADIVLRFRDDCLIRTECKRPMSSDTIAANIERAWDQICSTPPHLKAYGLIAVDVSKLIEQPGRYLEASSLSVGSKYLTDRVTEILLPFAKHYAHESLLGFFGFTSTPLVATARSAILKADGTPFEIENLRTGAISWVSLKNPRCSKGEILQDIYASLGRTTHDIPAKSIPMS